MLRFIKSLDPENPFESSAVSFQIKDGLTIEELVQQFGRFLVAIGYHPDLVADLLGGADK